MHIIIVNYCTARLVADCLRSLAPDLSRLPNPCIDIVDAASPDDSAVQLRDTLDRLYLDAPVNLRLLPHNTGFAAANNVAIRAALNQPDPPESILLLNPDTIVLPDAVPLLLEHLRSHAKVGIVAPRLENPDATPRHAIFRFHTLKTELHKAARLRLLTRLRPHWQATYPPPQHAFEPQWVSGACMLVRRELFERVGLFDEHFFMYYEEQDLARRAADAGYRIGHLPAARIIHLAGQSSGIQRDRPSRKPLPAYWYRSRQHYFRKHYGIAYTLTLNLLTASLTAARQSVQRLARRPGHEPPRHLRNLLRHMLSS